MKKILLRLILAFLKALFTLVLACIGVFLFEALSGLPRGLFAMGECPSRVLSGLFFITLYFFFKEEK